MITILSSSDTYSWNLVTRLNLDSADLRDPKLSQMPDGRLLLLAGGRHRDKNGQSLRIDSYVSISDDGTAWEPWQRIGQKGQWLWNLTWYKQKAYGFTYEIPDMLNRSTAWKLRAVSLSTTMEVNILSAPDITGYPSEGALCLGDDQQLWTLLRREGSSGLGCAWLGLSSFPFTEWEWKGLKIHIGGPCLYRLPSGELLVAGRMLTNSKSLGKTAIWQVHEEQLTHLLTLPSDGDNSYPSLTWHKGTLFIAYYSSHEGQASIYLAQIATTSS